MDSEDWCDVQWGVTILFVYWCGLTLLWAFVFFVHGVSFEVCVLGYGACSFVLCCTWFRYLASQGLEDPYPSPPPTPRAAPRGEITASLEASQAAVEDIRVSLDRIRQLANEFADEMRVPRRCRNSGA